MKRALRQALLAQRPAVMAAQPASAPLAVRDHYLAAFAPPPGAVVSAFWPMPGELDLRPLLEALHARGCICALPVVVTNAPLMFRSWEPGAPLVTSRFGIARSLGPSARSSARSTRSSRCSRSTATASALATGLYDCTLAALRADGAGPYVAIGAALAVQEHPQLPRETVRRAARRPRDRSRRPSFLTRGARAPAPVLGGTSQQ